MTFSIDPNSENPFGQHQKHVTIGTLLCYQLLIFPWGMFILYSLLILDWKVLAICLMICTFQYPFRKSETFIKFVNKYVQPTKYFKKFTRIVEEKIQPNYKILYGYHPHSIYSYSTPVSKFRSATKYEQRRGTNPWFNWIRKQIWIQRSYIRADFKTVGM